MKSKEISYVAVTIESRYKKGQTTGLFMALKPLVNESTPLVSADEKFIWLFQNDNVIIYNPRDYIIVSIYSSKGKGSETASFYNEGRQTNAISELEELKEELEKEKRVKSGGMIDIDSYEGLTSSLKEKINATSSGEDGVKASGKAPANFMGHGVHHSHASSSKPAYSKTTYPDYTTKTSVFRRTTKYPIGAAIKSMQNKILEIKSGTYKPPKLKEIPGDKTAEKEVEAGADVGTDHDDEFGNWCPYG
jgi:hypothetical protein